MDDEELELKHRAWPKVPWTFCCDLIVYSLAIGIPWAIGVWWLGEAVLFYLNFGS